MDSRHFLEDLQARIAELIAKTPAKEVEQNLRALLQHAFGKLDLASREQFDIQSELLARTRARLAELETRVAQLEDRLGKS